MTLWRKLTGRFYRKERAANDGDTASLELTGKRQHELRERLAVLEGEQRLMQRRGRRE